MSKILISTDSTADLPVDLLESRQIKRTSLHTILGNDDFKDSLDIFPADIVSFVEKTGELPKTSAVSIGEYNEFFEENLKEYDYIIHFSISSELSSTYNNARMSALEFDGRVAAIDSRNLSSGQGLLVLRACDLRDEGKSFEEIVADIEETKYHVEVSFVVDSVDYLYKGGRCSGAARLASNVLKIHPSIDMVEGKLVPKTNYRGPLKKCIEKYVLQLVEEYPDYDDTRVFVTHSSLDPNFGDFVCDIVKENFKFKEMILNTAGCVITSHCGPNGLGVLFIKK